MPVATVQGHHHHRTPLGGADSWDLGRVVDNVFLTDLLARLGNLAGDLFKVRQLRAPDDDLLVLERDEEGVGCEGDRDIMDRDEEKEWAAWVTSMRLARSWKCESKSKDVDVEVDHGVK